MARRKAFVILDGTLLSIDRVGIASGYDLGFFSGKHKRHGVKRAGDADPAGRLMWASPALPGARHDMGAAREHCIIDVNDRRHLARQYSPNGVSGTEAAAYVSQTSSRPLLSPVTASRRSGLTAAIRVWAAWRRSEHRRSCAGRTGEATRTRAQTSSPGTPWEIAGTVGRRRPR